jgi:hypothetical protein
LLHREIARIIALPVKARLFGELATTRSRPSRRNSTRIKAEIENWAKVSRAANIEADQAQWAFTVSDKMT